MSIGSTAINRAPATGAATISALENGAYTFQISDFPYQDPNNTPSTALNAVIVETLPGAGLITDNGVAVTAGQAVLASDIAQGRLVFTPAANGYGPSYTSFTFAVQNSGGTANGGQNTSVPATATINVAQSLDHPPTTANFSISAVANTPFVFSTLEFPFADPNDAPANALQAVVIVSLPGAGTLNLNGQAVTAGQVISASAIAAGRFTFVAAPGVASTSFQFEVQDNGVGTGSNTSAVATATVAITGDFSLAAGSPALNRGDPALQYFQEPVGGTGNGNGDRIDIGAAGGTSEANPSPAQLVQLLGATGDQRYQVGQATTISFRSAGLTALDPTLFINAGGGAVQGVQSWNDWQANEFNTVNGSVEPASVTVNPDGLNIPQAVLQNMLLFNQSSPFNGKYSIPVAAGTYQISLVFVDTLSTGVGQREFNILANGVTEATNYDVFKAAGGANKATEVTFDVTVAAGQGLSLVLQGVVGEPIISGIQISRVNPASTTWTASAEVSYDDGATWTTVATGLTLDQYGAGSFSFTPTATTSAGLFQIVATNGTNRFRYLPGHVHVRAGRHRILRQCDR